MRRTPHTAMLAAEQIAAGVELRKIEAEELGSLEAMIRAELQDREYRKKQGRHYPNNDDFIERYLYLSKPYQEPF